MFREYSPYGLMVAGIFLIIFGLRLLFQFGYVEKLMSKGRMWEHEEGGLFSKKEAYNYNKYGRGIRYILTGVLFIYLGALFLE